MDPSPVIIRSASRFTTRRAAVPLADALHSNLEELRSRQLEPVEVALLDTGVDANHPDLTGRVVAALDVVRSRSRFRAQTKTGPGTHDESGHGTAVASIIARIAPNAQIVDLRIAENEQEGRGEALLAGLRAAWERRSRVVNVSLACERRFLSALSELCEAAHFRNQVVVGAERNTPTLEKGLPAELATCIGVTCDRSADSQALRFRRNHRIEFSAAGRDVAVAAPGGSYSVRTGTSLAAGAVAGMCALLVGAHPELTPFEVKAILRAMAERNPRAT